MELNAFEVVVTGIFKLVYKLLVNDKAKFTALLVGIAFASFSMIFITAMFVGVLRHSSSTVINVGASMWVMDPAVQTPATRSACRTMCWTRFEACRALPTRSRSIRALAWSSWAMEVTRRRA